MYIKKIYIHTFGFIRERAFEFHDGMNIVEGANEAGKTTVGEFIKFVLFGFTSKAERIRCIGFGAECASGWMIIQNVDKQYRIERETTLGGRDRAQIIDLEANTRIQDSSCPGETLLGVPKQVFSATAYVGQADGNEVNGQDISNAVENILFSADENVNTLKALKKLNEARILLLHKNQTGGRLIELEEELRAQKARLRAAIDASTGIISKEGTLAELLQKIKQNTEQCESLKGRIRQYEIMNLARQYKASCAMKLKIKELTSELAVLNERYTHEGFFPGNEYIGQLRDAQNELDYINRSIDELEAEVEKLEGSEPDVVGREMFTAFVNEKGGKTAVMEKFSGNRSKGKALRLFGIIFAALAAIVLAAGIILFSGINSVFIFTACGSAALLLGSVITFILSARYMRNCKDILTEFDASDEPDLARRLDSSLADETKLMLHKDAMASLETRRLCLFDKQNTCERKIERLLAKWDKKTVDEALSEAQIAIGAVGSCKSELDKYTMALENVESQLRGYDEQEISECLKTPYSESELDSINISELRRRYEFATKAVSALVERRHELEKQLAEHYATAENPSDVADKIAETENLISQLRAKHDAYLLAHEKLGDAGTWMRESISPKLSENASRLIRIATDGKYSNIGVAGDLTMQYDLGENYGMRSCDTAFMSAGTLDIAYVSLRLALISLLYLKLTPPVIFDESFARLDDERLKNTFKMLLQTKLQSIIFTSQHREAQLAGELPAPGFNHIIM